MTHEYSVMVHEYLSDKMTDAEQRRKVAHEQKNWEMIEFCDGQIEEIQYLRTYLTNKVDLVTQKYY